MAGLARRRSLLSIGLPIAGAVLVVIGFAPGTFMVGRPADEFETVLYYFAQNIGEPSLCDHISWAAYTRYSLMFGGGGASYTRSDCYERVAESRRDPALCWHVRPLVDLDPLSSGYSAWSCRRRTRAHYHSGIALPDALLVRTFERLGYDIDTMDVDGVMPSAIRLRDVYAGLPRDSAAIARAKQLLAAADNVLSADDRRYLSQLTAIATNDPHWCDSIPPTMPVSDLGAPSRDACYLDLAYNSGDIGICDRMTPAALEPKVREEEAKGVRADIAEQLGLHGDCLRVADRIGPAHPYGPVVPSDAAQALRLLALLRVPLPRARDWSVNAQATYYRSFLYALWPQRPSEPGSRTASPGGRSATAETPDAAPRRHARAQLVARLIALAAVE
jgi:hypothetical protein